MILEAILMLSGVAAVGSVANLFMKNKEVPKESISIKKYMPGNLPIITLTNNGIALNFLIDTGSNISHICPKVLKDIKYTVENSNTSISGIGGMTNESAICKAKFKDSLSKEYDIQLVISSSLEQSAECIKEATGVEVHGLLGTNFLQEYKYVINFDELSVYVKK